MLQAVRGAVHFDEYSHLINDIAVLKIRASDFKFSPVYAKLHRAEDATLGSNFRRDFEPDRGYY